VGKRLKSNDIVPGALAQRGTGRDRRWQLIVLLGAVAVLAAACGDGSRQRTTTCIGGDRAYRVGDTWNDGCNDCVCNEDRTITCTAAECLVSCEHQGQTYQVGESWPAGDGCNLCSCSEVNGTGSVQCTGVSCGTPCVYAGVQREPGAMFTSLGGCNDCTCNFDGTVTCETQECPCDAASDWWRFYESTDVVACRALRYDCPANTTSFANDCGCGCEQDHTCGPSYDCRPPNQCDVEALRAACPYSEILER
jgi:hypothetical protein